LAVRLLIVDDDLSAIRLMNEALRGTGEVFFATDGEGAIRLAREKRPDIVLLGLQMPGMDGFEVCAALKAHPLTADATVFFVTADTDVEAETRAFGLGAADFIHKPISSPVVRARVRYHLVMKAQENELKRLAVTDPLTGLPNRRAFDDILDREWRRARRYEVPLAMIMVDVDHFKDYNDFYGHLAGDACLKTIAEILRSNATRPEDFVARYGGEEFVVLLPETGTDGAVAAADLLCNAVRAAEIEHKRSPSSKLVTASFGVSALVPDRGAVTATLVAAADAALYEAKNAGRNRVRYSVNGRIEPLLTLAAQNVANG
jgi:diguanylate cyclase (GGDEF)-like protein